MKIDTEKIKENIANTGKNVSKKIEKGKGQITKTIDQNGDGQITIEDVIIMGLKVPGIRIKREEFIKKEFSKSYSEDVVMKIIETNPAHENISLDVIDKIANDVIQYERLCVFQQH